MTTRSQNSTQVPFGLLIFPNERLQTVQPALYGGRPGVPRRQQRALDGQQLPRAVDIGLGGGERGAAAVVVVAAELELQRVLENLVGAQAHVDQVDLLVGPR